MNNYINELARQQGYTITHTSLSKLLPGGKKVHSKLEKTKAYQELIEYAKLGIDIKIIIQIIL